MATYTPNHNFKKPGQDDYYNIDDQNGNMDLVDAALTPTADPEQTPSGNGPSKLHLWVSWIANRIKAITGKANWYDAPATTLEVAKSHMDAAAPHTGHETPAGAQAKVNTAMTAHINTTDPHSQYALDTDVSAIQNTLSTHTADYVRQPGYGVTAGSANTYTLTLNPAPAAYVDGMGIKVKIHAANTGASTINVNGLSAKALVNGKGAVLTSGKLMLNGTYSFAYNSTSGNFILQGEGGEYGTATRDLVKKGYTIGTDDGLIEGTANDVVTDAQKAALVLIANAAEQNDLTTRTNYAAAITAKGVAASSADSHGALINKIAQIVPLTNEKKWVESSGSITSRTIDITNLPFTPSMIVVACRYYSGEGSFIIENDLFSSNPFFYINGSNASRFKIVRLVHSATAGSFDQALEDENYYRIQTNGFFLTLAGGAPTSGDYYFRAYQ